jgi:hypothetical protein
MTHTSQRRGLSPDNSRQELVVLAIIPAEHDAMEGIHDAFSDLASRMLALEPDNCIFGDSMPGIALVANVVTAVFSDVSKVEELIAEIKGDWLANNREKGYPISVVLSGLFGDVRECCRNTGCKEHTLLHSLGFYGKVDELPSADELVLMTMCGHGLVSAARVRDLIQRVRDGELTAQQAAEDLAEPCVCGVVNKTRAAEVFQRLAGES